MITLRVYEIDTDELGPGRCTRVFFDAYNGEGTAPGSIYLCKRVIKELGIKVGSRFVLRRLVKKKGKSRHA